jgi:hypothetical protein
MEKMLDLHDWLLQDVTQLIPILFLEEKMRIKNQNPFPLNTFGFESHGGNFLVIHLYSSFAGTL